MTDTRRHSLTIIICTFNRHALLTKALESIAAARRPAHLDVDVLVVDNSQDGNALPLVDDLSAGFPFALKGVPARPANISIARNTGVAATESEFIAFIDDDQEVDKDWLVEAEAVVEGHDHDVFFGSVIPAFETPGHADQTLIQTFSRSVDGPTGMDLFALGKQKTRGVALGSGNSIFRRRTTFTEPQPFDPAFGLSGGEDTELFCRLQRRGKRFGWAPLVKVHEFVPAARCEPDYLAARLFAGAQTFARSVSKNSPVPFLERMRQRGIALIQLMLLLPRSLLPGDEEQQLALRYKRALALGKLTFTKPEHYRSKETPDQTG